MNENYIETNSCDVDADADSEAEAAAAPEVNADADEGAAARGGRRRGGPRRRGGAQFLADAAELSGDDSGDEEYDEEGDRVQNGDARGNLRGFIVPDDEVSADEGIEIDHGAIDRQAEFPRLTPGASISSPFIHSFIHSLISVSC